MPKVSVIIPTHRRPELLKLAVASVQAQTYRDFELIIIEDTKSRGGGWARNHGIKKATGQYVAFLDDDDEWLPEKLEIQMGALEYAPSDVGFCFSSVINVYDDREETTQVPAGVLDCTRWGLEGFKFFLNVTLVIKRPVLDDVGWFDEAFPSHQESDLIIRITRKYRGVGINRPLVRVSMTGVDKVGQNIARRIAGRRMILEKYAAEFAKYPEILARHYDDLGFFYRRARDSAQAREMFRKALRLSWSFPRVLRYLRSYV